MKTNKLIKKDKYTKARGGSCKVLKICCAACNSEICLYQKDGPGALIRMYLDKILSPEEVVSKYSNCLNKKDIPVLKCKNCNQIIALPMVYEKENRLALKVIGIIRKSSKS